MQNERVLVVNHPLSDERTAYFRGIIEVKNILEIPYIPFPLEENGSIGVIVFDGPQTVVQRCPRTGGSKLLPSIGLSRTYPRCSQGQAQAK